jgi:adenylate cyclase
MSLRGWSHSPNPGEFACPAVWREHLRKHPIAFADLGEQKVRNIAQPVRAFKVRMGDAPDEVIDPVLEATRVDGPSMTPTTIEESASSLPFGTV